MSNESEQQDDVATTTTANSDANTHVGAVATTEEQAVCTDISARDEFDPNWAKNSAEDTVAPSKHVLDLRQELVDSLTKYIDHKVCEYYDARAEDLESSVEETAQHVVQQQLEDHDLLHLDERYATHIEVTDIESDIEELRETITVGITNLDKKICDILANEFTVDLTVKRKED
tara:strand:- start:88 stop:609 length:522 start_codon:yes stop_codon:yes gene_type:complete